MLVSGRKDDVMGIVWITSYPKSGNTWVRFLLANYLSGPIEDSAKVNALIPDLMKQHSIGQMLQQQPTVYAKTHLAWNAQHPFAEQTERAVMVVRHPKDVLLSSLSYRKLVWGQKFKHSDEEYARIFILAGGDPLFTNSTIGPLDSNLASWLPPSFQLPLLLVRYEDLKGDTRGEFAKIVSFLGVPMDDARLDMAVSRSSFDNMRAMEVREKASKKGGPVFDAAVAQRHGEKRFFMNEGKTVGSLAHIGPGLDEAFEARFGALIEALGYSKPG
jgi:hypothetical protein